MISATLKIRSQLSIRWFHSSISRRSNPSVSNLILNIPTANVYRFGDSNNAAPFFRDLEWSVKEGENWAVVGSGGGEKNALFQMLLGHLRIKPHPPPLGGLFPFLSESNPPLDPINAISIVSFSHRRAAGGGFYDYTARYGAVHEEDRLTLRQSMFPETIPPLRMPYEDEKSVDTDGVELAMLLSEEERMTFEGLVDRLGLRQFLDLPLIALSNGQTRRARILKAILKKPKLLLLDEPLTGLDVQTRPLLLQTLQTLHSTRSPRIIIGLRSQDTLPEWITHVAFVRGSKVTTGVRREVMAEIEKHRARSGLDSIGSSGTRRRRTKIGDVVVDLKNIKVQYQDRKVLDGITWQIRKGERWHLQGENGSGKTTLLSLITGDHPQSYTQTRFAPSEFSSTSTSTSTTLSHLHLFSQPRNRFPTPLLHSHIGLLSPELFDAFPRRGDMSVFEAVGTGFEGGFVPGGRRGVGTGAIRVGRRISAEELKMAGTDEDGEVKWEEEEEWRVKRVWEVLCALGPEAWEKARGELEGSSNSLASVASPASQPNSSKTRIPSSYLPSISFSPGTPSTSHPSPLLQSFASTPFASLPTAHQRIVLLARALVSRAPLILLDEVWSGMDEAMVRAARSYLRADGESENSNGGVREDQAVVVISHWEEEVPWGSEDNIYDNAIEGGPFGLFRKFRLSSGKGWVEG